MRLATKRKLMLAAVLALIVLPSEVLLLPVFDGRPGCVRIAEWVHGHSNVQPSTLEEMAAFPHSYRIRIIGELPVANRVSLWKQQMAHFRETHTVLTADQEDVLRHAEAITSPSIYAPGYDKTEFRALTARMRQVFSRHDYTELVVLANGVTAAHTFASTEIQLIETLRNKVRLLAEGPPDCDCFFAEDDCYDGDHCEPNPGCGTPPMCGFDNIEDCDGVCQ